MSSIAAVIPARLESTRLPRKLLCDLGGVTVLQRTVSQVQKSSISRIYVLTDSKEIQALCASEQIEAVMTSPRCQSGTERVIEAHCTIQADHYVNIQADEPFIDPNLIDRITQYFRAPLNKSLVTAVHRLTDVNRIRDPNQVKAFRNSAGDVLSFSRAPIPYVRSTPGGVDPTKTNYWGHVGIYGYSAKRIEWFASQPPSHLETVESLEQLRFIEAGYTFSAVEIDQPLIGIDTAEDLQRARATL